ncbi:MAG TPA: hypothetical protein G4O11_14015 [Anaerolineae bacterium]|nr:hypothetical protein [Anaerolineae bacterium]
MAGKTIRASEITQFTFCRRAWWYTRQGHPSDDSEERLAGIRWHRQHGRAVLAAGCLQLLGYAFLLSAVVAGVAHLTALALR